jgi:hypothetical protein
MRAKFEQEYDRIAASRIARLDGGLDRRVALSDLRAIRFKWKMQRLGLKGSHIKHSQQLIDDIAMNHLLSNHTVGVRFATIPKSKTPLDIWKVSN